VQVVQRYLRYEELLRDIRAEKVLELLFFSQRDTMYIEGVCLVAYRCGLLRARPSTTPAQCTSIHIAAHLGHPRQQHH
jgi:hypothetical protein